MITITPDDLFLTPEFQNLVNKHRDMIWNSSREEKIRLTQLFYLRFCVEDPYEGTNFDLDVLDKFRDLYAEWKGS